MLPFVMMQKNTQKKAEAKWREISKILASRLGRGRGRGAELILVRHWIIRWRQKTGTSPKSQMVARSTARSWG